MTTTHHSDARIFIVDDEPANVLLLEKLLRRHGYTNILSTRDSMRAVEMFDAFQPDIVLLDLHMPHKDGYEVLAELRERIPGEDFVPVLVLTADANQGTKVDVLGAGATDFLTKPLDNAEVMVRVQNLLRHRMLHGSVVETNHELERRVNERTRQLRETQVEVVLRLSLAAEYRDDDTGHHTKRVGAISALLASRLKLGTDFVRLIEQAAPLHDIGKVGIPDSILLKPGKLTPQEWEIMKTHTRIGGKILGGSPHKLLNLAEEIALTHHERHDGSGYNGMKGEEIPLSGRIVAVADVFDALTHSRPYKEAWPREKALEEIAAQRGRQFHPDVTDAFLGAIADGELDSVAC